MPFWRYKRKVNALKREIAAIKSFRDDWLPILHKDRRYLDRVSGVEERLRKTDGGIRVTSDGKEQNFLMERMRLRMLYYMATKHSLNK